MDAQTGEQVGTAYLKAEWEKRLAKPENYTFEKRARYYQNIYES
jgi:hypothetical protein